jgi:hypothetical protein
MAARDFTAVLTQQGRPVAALLVGRPGAMPAMRRLIHEHSITTPAGQEAKAA